MIMKRKAMILLISCLFFVIPLLADLEAGIMSYQMKDYPLAMQILFPLAESSDPQAQHLVGLMYRDGNGVSANLEEAIRWFKKAAEQGEGYSQFEIAKLYFQGKYPTKDKEDGSKWITRIAESGSPTAQFLLGDFFMKAEGGRQDYKEAMKWMRLAADQGDSRAFLGIGLMYINGNGVELDLVELYLWTLLADMTGHNTAQILEEIAEDMTPEQIDEAHRLAVEFLEKLFKDQNF